MFEVSQAFKDIIDGPSRHSEMFCIVHFPEMEPVHITDAEISKLTILRETGVEAYKLLGNVSSAELQLELDNLTGKFTPLNPDSPYYGKLVPGVKVEVFYRLRTSEVGFEEVPMGVFFTGEWLASSDSLTARVTCLDRLSQLFQVEVPPIPIQQHSTLEQLFRTLFRAMGLSDEEFVIDSTLPIRVPVAFVLGELFIDAVGHLTEASLTYLTTDRYGRLYVQCLMNTAPAVKDMFGHTNIISTKNTAQIYKTYEAATAAYATYVVAEIPDSLTNMSGVSLKTGLNTIKLSGIQNIVADVQAIIITQNVNDIIVRKLAIGAHKIVLTVYNPGRDQNVDIEVLGRKLKETKIVPQATRVRELRIENPYIQDRGSAEFYGRLMTPLVTDPSASISITGTGDPALDLLDTVLVADTRNGVPEQLYNIMRMKLNYDGAIRMDYTLMKQELMCYHEWCYIGLGLYNRVVINF